MLDKKAACSIFQNANNAFALQVFDVQLNSAHTIVENLDIFSKVGRGAAHDEVIPFTIKKGDLIVNGEKSSLEGNKMRVEFVKVETL